MTFIEHANAELDVPTVVRVLPYVFKVDQIDPLSMTAFAHIEIALRWRDDRVIEEVARDADGDGANDIFYQIKDGLLEDPEDPADPGWDRIWKPNLVFDQIIHDDNEESGTLEELAVCLDPVAQVPMLYMYRIYRNVVRVDMDLHCFPFDRNALKFCFMLQDQASTEAVLQLHEAKHLVDASACLDAHVDGATDGYELVSFRLVPHIREEEWSKVMARHGLLTEKEREGWKASGGRARFSTLEFRFDVRRESFFFLAKIIMVVYVLLLMELATFYMAEDDIGTRSSVSLTLFLTAVAFQFATTADLPKLPYLTYLDKLMCFMYLMLFAAYVENIVVFKVVHDAGGIESEGSHEDAREIDRVFARVFIGGIVASIVLLAVKGGRALCTVPAAFQQLHSDTLDAATVDPKDLKQLGAHTIAQLREHVPQEAPEEPLQSRQHLVSPLQHTHADPQTGTLGSETTVVGNTHQI